MSTESSLLTADSAWIDVIQKMDDAYADLVRYQVELETKNAELEETQRFIAGVQAAMTDVLIVCDNQGLVLQVNKALERITGRDPEQLIGLPLSDLFVPTSRDELTGWLRQLDDHPVEDRELSLLGSEAGDDAEVPLAINCSPRRDRRQRLIGYVLLGRPVGELRKAYRSLHQAHTELQTAQQQLVSSEKMASLGRLVAGVAHELNNPISFVYGNMFALRRYGQRLGPYLDAIHANVSDAERERLRRELRIDKLRADLDDLIQGTIEGAERVRAIVEDLRRFSSTKQGEYASFDIIPVIRTAVDWVIKGNRGDGLAEAGLDIELALPATLTVYGHAGQMQQVLMNLVQNALDAMRETARRRLRIVAEDTDDRAQITVQDSGPGIAVNHLLHVFDPFFTTKPVGQGTGLGLAISYRIVSEHGGRLEARNHSRGGAVLRIELPKHALQEQGREQR